MFPPVKRFALLLIALCAALVPVSVASADFSFQTTTLEPAGGNHLETVAVGDVDGRNGPDLVTAYSAGGIAVQLNDGHGHFGAPVMYETGCEVSQVELADVGGPPESIQPDGHLDVVISCVEAGGDHIYLGRMFGDGNGGFSAPHLFVESDYGFANGLALSHQSFALVEFRGPSGPPVPVWTYLSQPSLGHYERLFCLSYDWASRQCTDPGANPQPYVPFLAARVADAELFTTGGTQGLLDWGPSPIWHAGERDFGPEPESSDPADAIWRGIAVGDLESDGPDTLTSAGDGGAVLGDSVSGRVSVLYGNTATGVPAQHATTFPSAPGVENINTGDFDLDGHTDVVGINWHYAAATGGIGGLFFQAGDGTGHLAAPQKTTLYHGETWNTAPIGVADLDGNGSPDVVAVVGGKVQVLLNQKLRPPVVPAPGTAVVSPLSGIKGLSKKVSALANGTLLLGSATNPPTAGVGLTLTIPAVGKGKGKDSARAAAAKPKQGKKKKETVIGKAKITVPAGKTVPLKLKLSAKAKALLAKGPLHAKLAIKATSTAGVVKEESRPLTIASPQVKKHKHHARHGH
jgi:FG-GAP-like repeat